MKRALGCGRQESVAVGSPVTGSTGAGHGKALIPISLDHRRFRTETMRPALEPIAAEFEELIVFVPDDLQLYNKVTRSGDRLSLGDSLRQFAANNRYLDERKRWIAKLLEDCCKQYGGTRFSVVGVKDVADGALHSIHRNVWIAYNTLESFHAAVDWSARAYVVGRRSEGVYTAGYALSVGYILEEIAINIRLRVLGKVEAEFYIGPQLEPLAALYFGAYGVDVFTLAAVEPYEMTFKFFELSISPGSQRCEWQPCRPAELSRDHSCSQMRTTESAVAMAG